MTARVVAYLLIFAGCGLLADTAYDEHRGVASATAPGRSIVRYVASRSEKPEDFRGLIAYEWIRGFLFLGAGGLLLSICRRADRLDPFSPRFAGKTDLEELERTLDEEQKKRASREKNAPFA
jgi:hypothetical protein